MENKKNQQEDNDPFETFLIITMVVIVLYFVILWVIDEFIIFPSRFP